MEFDILNLFLEKKSIYFLLLYDAWMFLVQIILLVGGDRLAVEALVSMWQQK